MLASEGTEPALRWTCPACRLEWIAVGAGFPGHRFSACLRCGEHAGEAVDATPVEPPPRGGPIRAWRSRQRR